MDNDNEQFQHDNEQKFDTYRDAEIENFVSPRISSKEDS